MTAEVQEFTPDESSGTPAVAELLPVIPPFEGLDVHATSLKIVNSAALDLPDVVLRVDDIIHILVEARVMSVNHIVHEASGRLVRMQTAKPLEAKLVPFAEGEDDGVIRE